MRLPNGDRTSFFVRPKAQTIKALQQERYWRSPSFPFLPSLRPPARGAQSAERLIAGNAVDTLPPDLRGYFEANRDFIIHHVTEPLDLLARNPRGRAPEPFPLSGSLRKISVRRSPRDYKAAVGKYSRTKLETSGVLPCGKSGSV